MAKAQLAGSTSLLTLALLMPVLPSQAQAKADPTVGFEIRPVAKNSAGLSDSTGNMVFAQSSYPKFFTPPPVSASKESRQAAALLSPEQTAQSAALVVAAEGLDCSKPDPLRGADDPKLPLVACSSDGKSKYVLEPAVVDGSQVSCAKAAPGGQAGQYVVSLDFKPDAQKAWAKYASGHAGTLTAFTWDARVFATLAAQGAMAAKQVQLVGGFTSRGADDLAQALGGCNG